MKQLILQIFTWWNGQTLGTRLHTWRRGKPVGEDAAGNRYFRDPRNDRRWVVYNGYAEGSAVPPGWNSWLHHTTDLLPGEDGYRPKPWEKPHLPNMTGTPRAYRPKGSIQSAEKRPTVTGDYDAWKP